jgi:Transposase DDE domain
LAKAEEKGYSVLVNLEEAKGPYHASRFTYDAHKDQCVCPRGEALPFDSMKARNKVQPYEVRVYRCQSYETCPVRWQCSKSKSGRTVQIHPNYDALVRQREKLKDERMRTLLKQRGSIIEPLFGWSKEAFHFRRWTVRGLEKVRTQWVLLCTAMNLRRLHRHWAARKVVFG